VTFLLWEFRVTRFLNSQIGIKYPDSLLLVAAPMDGFAFTEEDYVLETIRESEGDDGNASIGPSENAHDVEIAKARTAALAAAAEHEILELRKLLGKLKTGTATRVEKERINSLNVKLCVMRKDIDASKTRESNLEWSMHRAMTSSKAFELKKIIKEKEIRSVIQAVCSAEKVDLAFIIDATGSMSSYIDAVKRNIREVVSKVLSTNGNLNLRLAVVAYRDIADGSNRYEVLDFVSIIGDFEHFLSSLKAVGGADTPEDMTHGGRNSKS